MINNVQLRHNTMYDAQLVICIDIRNCGVLSPHQFMLLPFGCAKKWR